MAVAGRAESELNQGAAVTDDNPNVAKLHGQERPLRRRYQAGSCPRITVGWAVSGSNLRQYPDTYNAVFWFRITSRDKKL